MLFSHSLRLARRAIQCSRLPAKAFCTETTLDPRVPDHFRTLEKDPGNHTLNHEGKFYTIDQEVMNNVFNFESFHPYFREQLQVFRETCLMVRKPALEAIHHLKNADYSLPPIRYMLYSKNLGAGLSLSLYHILHYAWLRNWVIVHAYMPYWWVKCSRQRWLQQSIYNPKRMDQNLEATKWLKHFKKQNAQFLEKIRLSKTYTWSQREISEQGEPLSNVIEHGLTRITHATDCLSVILKEIKLQSGPNTFRTLVVVDGVNCLFGDVKYKLPDHTPITVDDLTIVRGFKKLLSNDWSNGAVVMSVDPLSMCRLPKPEIRPTKLNWPYKNPYVITKVDPFQKFEKERCCYPKELLGSNGFTYLDPFVPIEVEKFSRKEAESCLDYYLDRNYLQTDEAHSEEGREELIFLSGCIPRDLGKYCASL